MVVSQFDHQLMVTPEKPGVYLMKDESDKVIYVGKASVLRNRLRSYFGSPSGLNSKIRRLVSRIADFEFIVTDTEAEALILENTLIKRYRPHFNARLKDDKTYPFLKIDLSEEFPRVYITRHVSFKLTVNATEKVRSIQLFYRINNSHDWTSVVKRFDDRYHITTEFVLNTSGSNFLTPQSTIKYFYDISDETGFTLKTKEQELKYLDPRFEWNYFTARPLTVFYHDRTNSDIEVLIRDLAVQIETIKTMFSIENPDPIKGVVYNHRSELSNILPDKTTIPEIYHGFAFLDQQIFLGIGD